eukprot:NODE_858_length_3653_cov_0.483118.p3 type:complete len:105 gc:universal NODE_858_length_3653_cov_0.483118:793-1107(+)
MSCKLYLYRFPGVGRHLTVPRLDQLLSADECNLSASYFFRLTYSGLHRLVPFTIWENVEYRVFKLLEKSGKVLKLYKNECKNEYKLAMNDLFKKTIQLSCSPKW